jgi:hypothetical protein
MDKKRQVFILNILLKEGYLIELQFTAVAESRLAFLRIAQTFIVEISGVNKTVFICAHK